MSPLELMSEEEWGETLEQFARKTKMTVCLGDPEGKPILCRADRYPLCMAIRGNKEALTFTCSQAASAMSAVIQKTGQPELDYCQVGLIRVAIPVIRDGKAIGQVFACGIASQDEEIDIFSIAKQLAISEDEARVLAEKTPVGSEEEIENLTAELFAELNG